MLLWFCENEGALQAFAGDVARKEPFADRASAFSPQCVYPLAFTYPFPPSPYVFDLPRHSASRDIAMFSQIGLPQNYLCYEKNILLPEIFQIYWNYLSSGTPHISLLHILFPASKMAF